MSEETLPKASVKAVQIHRNIGDTTSPLDDLLAVEEPLEIRVTSEQDGVWLTQPIAVTMRTPGQDFELAAGFLLTEEVVQHPDWIERIERPPDEDQETCNVVNVVLRGDVSFDISQLSRHTFTSSSCGICGKQTIDRIRARHAHPPLSRPLPEAAFLKGLPRRLAAHQAVFQGTGGLHASALFDAHGDLVLLREDVGRHNALDKLIGRLLLDDALPADNLLLLLSGRASFELVQKAVIAGIGTIAALGPPSSLAVDLAVEFGVGLVGFLKEDRYNVYHEPEINPKT